MLYRFDGDNDEDCFGSDVNSAGDINKDGVDDLIVGASRGAYLRVFSGIDGSELYTRQATATNTSYAVGSTVSGAEDVNGDGYADFFSSDSDQYVEVFSGLDGSTLLSINSRSTFGQAIAPAGDVDGDGLADLAISSYRYNTSQSFNGMYSGRNGQAIWSSGAAKALDTGDFDGDGRKDLVVGSYGLSDTSGTVMVVKGKDGEEVSRFQPELPGEEFGRSVSYLQDINGDGIADILIGSPESSADNVTRNGKAFVLVSQLDSDGDRIADDNDDFPLDPKEQVDTDGDGVGDNTDVYIDDLNEWANFDGDEWGDNADTDDDNDGIVDEQDEFPFNPNEWSDADGDGVGDNSDAFPTDDRETVDTDGDGIGNNADQDDDNDLLSDSQERALGLFPLMADSDGDLIIDGEDTNPYLAKYQVVAGGYQNCALHDEGVTCWGDDTYQQLTIPDLIQPKQVVSDGRSVCAMDEGQVRCWGSASGSFATPYLGVNLKQIAMGSSFACVLDGDDVNCWGSDYSSNVISDAPKGLSNPRHLSIGSYHACIVDDEGLHCWGDDDNIGEIPENLGLIYDLSAGDNHSCVINDEGVMCWGNNDTNQLEIPDNLINPRQVQAGGLSTCVLDDEGVKCWTKNSWNEINVETIAETVQLSVNNRTACILLPYEARCYSYHNFDVPRGLTFFDGIYNPDADGDGIEDRFDAFPLDPTETVDTDGDGKGNNADTDDDQDGFLDTDDTFPLNAEEWLDTDGDGEGNNADNNDDNDLFVDADDAFPLDSSEWADTDMDGIGDASDPFPLSVTAVDSDLDGMLDSWEIAHGLDHLVADGTEDPDGDGYSNKQEFDGRYSPMDIFSPQPIGINDTGIQECFLFDDDGGSPVDCATLSTSLPAGQDGHTGRDILFNDDTDGTAGFDFSKLDASGNLLSADASAWSCVRDNVTGHIWEVKKSFGLHNASHTYTWYTSDAAQNGGDAGTPNGGVCSGSNCDTDAFIHTVNTLYTGGLCGVSQWRLPNREELDSIYDYQSIIDRDYFPYFSTGGTWYWTSTSAARNSGAAWGIYGASGQATLFLKYGAGQIRLIGQE